MLTLRKVGCEGQESTAALNRGRTVQFILARKDGISIESCDGEDA